MTRVTCATIEAWVFEIVEGKLPADDKAGCDAHLGKCPPCVRIIESYKATITFAHALPKCQRPLPAEFEARLRALLGS